MSADLLCLNAAKCCGHFFVSSLKAVLQARDQLKLICCVLVCLLYLHAGLFILCICCVSTQEYKLVAVHLAVLSVKL